MALKNYEFWLVVGTQFLYGEEIFETINYCKYEVDSWYELIKDKRKIRLVNIHNNLSLDHYIKNDKPYLISWNKNKIDMPIYDLIKLYASCCF